MAPDGPAPEPDEAPGRAPAYCPLHMSWDGARVTATTHLKSRRDVGEDTMSVLYRAIWSDQLAVDRSATVETLERCVAAWTQETPNPKPIAESPAQWQTNKGLHRSLTYRSLDPAAAFEVWVNDQNPDAGSEWKTLVRCIVDDSLIHMLVENHLESDDLTKRVSIGRPKVVHELLRTSTKPVLGNSAILTEPESIPAEGIQILTDMLADPGRTLPVVVCSEPGSPHDGAWRTWAKRIATRTEGIATVITLDSDAVTALRDRLGDLAVWGGSIRIFAPGPVTPDSDGWRHKFYIRPRLEKSTQATLDRIVYSVAQLSARRRVPDVFNAFTEETSHSDGLTSAAELDEATEQWEFELDLALEEQSNLQKELAKANGHLSRLREELTSRGLTDLIWGTEYESGTSVPDDVQDSSEAVLAARTYLHDWLSIPESAEQELADIDTAPSAYSWGNNTWRGLRALAAYAEDCAHGWGSGNFWQWCASGPLVGWPATPKKLSMTESDTVQNRDRYNRTRIFEVDEAVDASGETMMFAHLKIAEGGGRLAPRVYFYDDTGGSTGKVHVGFVGPHHLVPNKSTN